VIAVPPGPHGDPVVLRIVIVNRDTAGMLRECLTSIVRHPPSTSWDAVVVDNGSIDDSINVARAFPFARVIANARNVGFAVANNQVLRDPGPEFFLLLNSDTEVGPAALDGLLGHIKADSAVGVVACRLTNSDGSTQRSAWLGYPGVSTALADSLYLWRLSPSLVFHREVSLRELKEQVVDVDHVLGACMMVRAAVLHDAGLLDEGFALFLEETEWCRRIKAAGWRIIYAPQYDVLHHGQATVRQFPTEALPQYYRSLFRFVRLGKPARWKVALLKAAVALGVGVRFLLWTYRRATFVPGAEGMLRGYRSAIHELFAM
jgi:N-acetylglucosaminyl-diphospho-decaprenol L-rhamnosyltransferase